MVSSVIKGKGVNNCNKSSNNTLISKIPLGIKLKILLILSILSIIVLLVIYLTFDSNISNLLYYESSEASSKYLNSDYKSNFEKLISKIENNQATGIPSVDNAGVTTGKRIDITPGVGEFANMYAGWGTQNKSHTYINYGSFGVGTRRASFIYGEKFLSNCTLYERSGTVKFLDKYTPGAIGTYFGEAFNLPGNEIIGKLVRVGLDTGKTFDMIIVDQKGSDAGIKAVSNPSLTIAHTGSKDIGHSVVEFEIIKMSSHYPVGKVYGNKFPGINYENIMTIKQDPGHMSISIPAWSYGSHDIVPEYQGNVTYIELISDPDAEKLIEECVQDYKSFLSSHGITMDESV